MKSQHAWSMGLVLALAWSAGCSGGTSSPAPAPANTETAGQSGSELAKYYLETRDLAKARETLRGMATAGSASPEEYAQLSELYLANQERDKGEQVLREGLQRFPKHPYLTLRLGSYLAAITRYKDAVPVLQQAEALAPTDPTVVRTLTLAQARLGDHKEAAAAAGRLYKLVSGRDEAILYASQLDSAGDLDAAERIYREVLAQDTENLLVQNNLAVLLAEKGQLAEAERLVQRALKKAPNNGRVLDTLGWVQYRQGKQKEAAETLQRAVTLAPDAGAVHYHQGLVLAAQGTHGEAKRALTEALRLEPTARWAADAQAALAGNAVGP